MPIPSSLGQALSLAVLRRPRSHLLPGGGRLFLLAAMLFLGAGLLLDTLLVSEPRVFDPLSLAERSHPLLLALVIGSLLSWSCDRGALWLRVAALWLLAATPLLLLLHALRLSEPDAPPALHRWEWALLISYGLLVIVQLARQLAGRITAARMLVSIALSAALAIAGPALLASTPWWWHWSDEDWQEPPLAFSPEQLFRHQPARVEQALDALLPQQPGRVDLYLLAFAGDGEERVFRNEAEYAERLFAQRFAADGRSVILANASSDPDRHALATLSNLRHALSGIAERIDPEEDIVMLFVTTHGSENHELLVSLDPLPLDQITPDDLRAALDDAGIRHRVLVISACYSGGFIPALESPDTLIVTAAREDRSSFGCGPDADITWFGRAFLAEALNAESDFGAAFADAERRVRAMEREAGIEASHPQIRIGARIAERLRHWRAGWQAGPPLPFEPASAHHETLRSD